MGETDWGGYWVLFWWAGPCYVNPQSNILLINGDVFPPCFLTWGQTMVEVMKIMETSFKSSHTQILPHSVPLILQQATANPCLCQRLLDMHGQSGSVSCEITVPFSRVLMHTGFVCAFQESVSPVPCKFWDSMVGLMVTSSKKTFAIPRSAAPRAPAPAAGHCWPIPLQETLKHSSGSVSVGSLGPGAYKEFTI